MPIVQADRLTRIGAALLEAAGASTAEANAVAVGCVNANLAGHDSHGVIPIPTYIDRVKAGHIVPGAKWSIVRESPTTTVIDGHWGFGFHVNGKATDEAELKANDVVKVGDTELTFSMAEAPMAQPALATRFSRNDSKDPDASTQEQPGIPGRELAALRRLTRFSEHLPWRWRRVGGTGRRSGRDADHHREEAGREEVS